MTQAVLVDDADWAALTSVIASYDTEREKVIKCSRDGQKASKQAIYALHREDFSSANRLLAEAEAVAAVLAPTLTRFPMLRPGTYSAFIEEYAEAAVFRTFLQEGRLALSSELPLTDPEEYLGGVMDFTGELNRYSIMRATVRDKAAVQACRDLVDALMGKFLQFDFRNGNLRKKFDSLKYTLQKMENTLYELSLSDASLGGKRLRANDEVQPAEPADRNV
ncbi:MAG: hypothetical protein WDW36_002730 [Sanguina aurantia]